MHAGTFSSSVIPPTVQASDISNLAAQNGTDKWFFQSSNEANPSDAAKPNISYPLPDSDGSSGVATRPVKVFILSGQSNMVGMGQVSGTEAGTLQTLAVTEKKFPNLLTAANAWTTRNDVCYRGLASAIGNAPLAPGQGADTDSFGPELGFGHVVGWHHDEPVLIIKTSIGNRALGWDFLPPGSVPYTYSGTVYAGYGDYGNYPVGGTPPASFVWYAGKQYDDSFLAEANMGAKAWATGVAYVDNCQVRRNGVTYISSTAHTSSAANEPGVGAQWTANWTVYSVFNVTDILDNWATQYPQWAAQGFEIAGFGWFQGYNDGQSSTTGWAIRYEQNLARLIRQLRLYYQGRYPGKIKPSAPFVTVGCGFDGWAAAGNRLTVVNAQFAMTNAALYPDFAGNVKTMEGRGYWRTTGPNTAQGHHYWHHAETFMLVGDAMGRGMVELLAGAPGSFAAWQYVNGDSGAMSDDHDGDGVSNGIEWFLGSTAGFTALPGVVDTAGTRSVSWTKAATFTGVYGTAFVVETTNALGGTWTPEPLGTNVIIAGNIVKFTFPAGAAFARLKVITQ